MQHVWQLVKGAIVKFTSIGFSVLYYIRLVDASHCYRFQDRPVKGLDGG
jgi:hypothetical protein